MLYDIINNKKNNIGSLCSYIKNHDNLLNELELKINDINLILPQKIWFYYNNIDISYQYCQCGKQKVWLGFKHGWRKTCGNKECIDKQRKTTNLKKYGVDNPLKNKNIRDKIKITLLDKYGVNYPIQSISIMNKIKKTIHDKYGVYHPMQSDIIKLKNLNTWNNKTDDDLLKIKEKKISTWNNKTEIIKKEIDNKRKTTNLKKYGVEYIINHIETKEKIKKTLKDKYNVNNSQFENPTIRKKSSITYKKNKIKQLIKQLTDKQCTYIQHINNNDSLSYTLLCNRTNKKFNISYTSLKLRLSHNMEISPFFYKKHGQSDIENEFKNFINQFSKYESNLKNIIPPYEIDIYIPELKLAFEFNGLYWHNELHKDKNYHLNKTKLCEKKGIQLIHIWEDNWIYKQDIIKSMILNKLGKTPNRIYARKCEIKEINDNKLIRNFLEKNHIQGFIGSKIKIGLFYDNELVSLMTFGKNRIPMGYKNSNINTYEMLRFCNKLNTNVIGGASKLFKYFIKNYNPNEIITYADRSHSNGNLYYKLGFNFLTYTQPNYYYIIDNIRHYRFNYRKDKLIKLGYNKNKTEHEIMIERKIYRIYDSGNLKFIYNNS